MGAPRSGRTAVANKLLGFELLPHGGNGVTTTYVVPSDSEGWTVDFELFTREELAAHLGSGISTVVYIAYALWPNTALIMMPLLKGKYLDTLLPDELPGAEEYSKRHKFNTHAEVQDFLTNNYPSALVKTITITGPQVPLRLSVINWVEGIETLFKMYYAQWDCDAAVMTESGNNYMAMAASVKQMLKRIDTDRVALCIFQDEQQGTPVADFWLAVRENDEKNEFHRIQGRVLLQTNRDDMQWLTRFIK